MNITSLQKLLLQHMLGADVRYTKDQWGFRNHFATSPDTDDYKELKQMEELGLVKSGERFEKTFFWATRKGAEAIGFKPYQLKKAEIIDADVCKHCGDELLPGEPKQDGMHSLCFSEVIDVWFISLYPDTDHGFYSKDLKPLETIEYDNDYCVRKETMTVGKFHSIPEFSGF